MGLSSPSSSLKAVIQTLLADASGLSESTQDLGVSLLGFTSLFERGEPLFTDDNKAVKSPYAGYGVDSAKGLPKHMEDSFSVQEKLSSPGHTPHQSIDADGEDCGIEDTLVCFPEDLAFFSVFDGHGGDHVALHCSERLHQHFTKQLMIGVQNSLEADSSSASPSETPKTGRAAMHSGNTSSIVMEALRSAFHSTDQELAGTDEGEFIGATAVVAVVGRQHIWLAHCGDSRAVIQRHGDGVALTSDHKPDRADEAARIRAAGGRIVHLNGANRVMGMLAMSRSIGDHYLRPFVTADPEVVCIERQPEDGVLVIATDGLWDVFSCTEAVNLASRCITRSMERGLSKNGACRVASSILAKAALARGSRDNITVIIVDLALPPDAEAAEAQEVASSAKEQMAPSTPSSSMGTYMLLKSQKQDRSYARHTHSGSTWESPRQNYSHNDLNRLCAEQEEGVATPAFTSMPCGPSRSMSRSKSCAYHSADTFNKLLFGDFSGSSSEDGGQPKLEDGSVAGSVSDADDFRSTPPKFRRWQRSAVCGAPCLVASAAEHALEPSGVLPSPRGAPRRVSFDLDGMIRKQGGALLPMQDASESLLARGGLEEDSGGWEAGSGSAHLHTTADGIIISRVQSSSLTDTCMRCNDMPAYVSLSSEALSESDQFAQFGPHGGQNCGPAHHDPDAGLALTCP